MIKDFLFLQSNCSKNIGVVGDSMIDIYHDVKVRKISPEFPIPVMHSTTFDALSLPGGASNVVNQFKDFNFKTSLFSFLDLESKNILIKNNLVVDSCKIIKNLIPRKIRFYSDDFPTYRWDVEKEYYGYNSCEIYDLSLNYLNNCKKNLKEKDVVVFSDYDKGIFSSNLNLVKECKVSIVDPKSTNIDKWKGCTIFKPNAKEALYISGESTIDKAAVKLKEIIECEAVVITEAGDGVTLFDKDGLFKYKPCKSFDLVESVIGAGDCFVSFLAMGMSHNFSIRECIHLAWEACKIYVRNRHNKSVTKVDLLKSINDYSYKILEDYSLLKKENRDYKLVFTNGCYDLFHTGHAQSLKFAKSLGDKLVVAVNTDSSVSLIKDNRPILKLEDRIELLSNFDFVDYIIIFNESSPFNIIKDIKPDVLVKGEEYKNKLDKYKDYVSEIKHNPMIEGISTTKIIEKINCHN